jgi:hypothetical protein
MLIRIVRLVIAKIRNYIKDLCAAQNMFEEPVSAVESRITKVSNSAPGLQPFPERFWHIRAIKDLPPKPEPIILIHYVKWAQKARGCYVDSLRAAFSSKF